jgi:hypothetical protein
VYIDKADLTTKNTGSSTAVSKKIILVQHYLSSTVKYGKPNKCNRQETFNTLYIKKASISVHVLEVTLNSTDF